MSSAVPKSYRKIREEIFSGRKSCVEIVRHYLENISLKKHLNAFLEVYSDEAHAAAITIDEKIKNNKAGKLAGMVISLKDVIVYKNHKASASSRILENFESLFSATAVERLLQEDAIIIGRTNCDEFAMGSSNENSSFGHVLNPLDESRVPGGSSGGAAVSVAAGMCTAALGTDTGGSIRQPASFCGLVGLKPTYGRISRWGLIAYASSFDQIGPLCRTVEDAAILLEVMAGSDEFDATSSPVPVESYTKALEDTPTSGYRIAIPEDALHSEGVDSQIRDFTLTLSDRLKKSGHIVEPVSFPYLDYVVPVYYVLTTAEASSNLARYDGVRYGHRTRSSGSLEEMYVKSRTEGFGWEVKRRIMLGTFVLREGYYDAYYTKAQQLRGMIRAKTLDILRNFDFIILPTTPTTAFRLGEKVQDPVQMYLSDIFTVHAPLAGVPAISLPLGQHSSGLPFGIQVMSAYFSEKKLLAFSNLLMTQYAQK